MKNHKGKAKKLSPTSQMHCVKLIYRSLFFLGALIFYIVNRIRYGTVIYNIKGQHTVLLLIIWTVLFTEIILRFFPSKIESPGSQKQFSVKFKPTGKSTAQLMPWQKTFAVAALWLLANGFFGVMYYAGIIDKGILFLLSMAYSVCDIICILFFCPFQTWFMKNKCCTSCRIYNWDFPMMFTPFIFIKSFYTWSLLAAAVALLIKWEMSVRLYPERFSEKTNASLSCANCTEKLCSHKKQLQQFLRQNRQEMQLNGNLLFAKEKIDKPNN